MNKKMMVVVALIGMTLGLTAQSANSHPGDSHNTGRFGPAYIYHGDGFHRFDRSYRYRPGNRHRRLALQRRSIRQRDLWHHCFNGRWYPYNDRQHRRFHEKLRYERGKRYSQRYRYW